jgi:hypothetical protein
MPDKKKDKEPVIDTHNVTPDADEVKPNPKAKMPVPKPKGLRPDDLKPRKKGKPGPMKVGVGFDHTDA